MKKILFIFLMTQVISAQSNWYKGNLHTHSLWSDGDDFPEMIINWYKTQGYDFVALSDHNIIAEGEKWVTMAESSTAFKKYLQMFGEEWVEYKKDTAFHVRLKTYDEFKKLLEVPGKFLIIKSEELTDRFEKKPIHINATNIHEMIEPQHGNSVYEVMQNNIDAINEQRNRTGKIIMPHVNHPNFVWAVTAEDIINLKGDKLFEIYNGHPLVHNYGDSIHAGTEEMWDIILAERLSSGKDIMYGIAVDDAHNYFSFDPKQSNPGRGWVVVKADSLTPENLIHSMETGNFYASSGVELSEINISGNSINIKIKPEEGVEFKTQFIGTKKNYTKLYEERKDSAGTKVTGKFSDELGIVFSEVSGLNPSFNFKGDELYVRAKIISSKVKINPYQPGEYEQAWVQPVQISGD